MTGHGSSIYIHCVYSLIDITVQINHNNICDFIDKMTMKNGKNCYIN